MAITVDQLSIGQNTAASGDNIVLTTSQPVVAGATIIVWFSWESPAAQAFVSIAGGGLTWDPHLPSQSLLGNYNLGYAVAYAPAGLASSTAITMTISATDGNLVIFGSSFLGVLSASPIDDENHGEDDAPSANADWTCATLTTTQAGDLVAACSLETQDGSRASTPVTDYLETHQFGLGADDTWTAIYRIVGAADDYFPGGTWNNAAFNGWASIGVALKAAPTVAGRVYKRLYGPTQLTGSAADLYTCPASTKTRILHIHASNPSAASVDVNLSIGADAAATRVWDDLAVGADRTKDDYTDYTLSAGEKIQGWADSAATVTLTISGIEVPA